MRFSTPLLRRDTVYPSLSYIHLDFGCNGYRPPMADLWRDRKEDRWFNVLELPSSNAVATQANDLCVVTEETLAKIRRLQELKDRCVSMDIELAAFHKLSQRREGRPSRGFAYML
jgi:hypothetical protein